MQLSPIKGAPAGAFRGPPVHAKSPGPEVWKLRTGAKFASTTLSSASGLTAQITDGGALFAFRHGGTLINQSLPWPAEDGFFRLILRWRFIGGPSGWAPLVGLGVDHRKCGPCAFEWAGAPARDLKSRVTLTVDAEKAAWAWHIHLDNKSRHRLEADVLLAQDLGLGDEAAVRNSEAFASQYIDLLPVKDAKFGWAILARQNLAMEGGRHPWLATACASGATAYCTDGFQFFGTDHRLMCSPKAVRLKNLQRKRLQYEAALAGLQSKPALLEPGASGEVLFVARFLPDHPEASCREDLSHLRQLLPAEWAQPKAAGTDLQPLAVAKAKEATSLFVAAPWLHGDRPEERDWTEWFPGKRRHEEIDGDGRIMAFFSGTSTHVVARGKEAMVERPHGHIYGSGDWRWSRSRAIRRDVLCCVGIFSAQAYLGNPTFGRSLARCSQLARNRTSSRAARLPDAQRSLAPIGSAFRLCDRSGSVVRWIYRPRTRT